MSRAGKSGANDRGDPPTLTELLNGQTARIGWDELARHFARGAVVRVDPALDLLEIAGRMVRDDTAGLQSMFDSGQVIRASDEHARRWAEGRPVLWAVVVAPWVLVQELGDED